MSQISSLELEPNKSEREAADVKSTPLASKGVVPKLRETRGNKRSTLEYDDVPESFRETLESAERLLAYAAETGVDVEDATRNSILQARAAGSHEWNENIPANLLVALTKLSAQLKPVSAESLKASTVETRRTVRSYWIVAICLAIFIVPVSVATFVTSAISDAIRKDIATANELAVKLTAQLKSPTVERATIAAASGGALESTASIPPGVSQVDVITELQSFAAAMRAIDTRARQSNWFIFRAEKDPFKDLRNTPAALKAKLQLPVPLPSDLAPVANGRIEVYQDVRSFAQSVVDDVSVFYGAITTCVLPVLYALLGTCAYLLRSFEQDMRNRTFTRSHADSPRFLIAGIGGAVVGLFHTFTITQEASIPPLAIAFMVGYAVDVFFSFLEGLIQAFTRGRSASNTPSVTVATGKTG